MQLRSHAATTATPIRSLASSCSPRRTSPRAAIAARVVAATVHTCERGRAPMTEPSIEEMRANVETVRRFYDALAATDLETILAITDAGIEVVQTDLLPWGG